MSKVIQIDKAKAKLERKAIRIARNRNRRIVRMIAVAKAAVGQ